MDRHLCMFSLFKNGNAQLSPFEVGWLRLQPPVLASTSTLHPGQGAAGYFVQQQDGLKLRLAALLLQHSCTRMHVPHVASSTGACMPIWPYGHAHTMPWCQRSASCTYINGKLTRVFSCRVMGFFLWCTAGPEGVQTGAPSRLGFGLGPVQAPAK